MEDTCTDLEAWVAERFPTAAVKRDVPLCDLFESEEQIRLGQHIQGVYGVSESDDWEHSTLNQIGWIVDEQTESRDNENYPLY